jgi:hypothetical protein
VSNPRTIACLDANGNPRCGCCWRPPKQPSVYLYDPSTFVGGDNLRRVGTILHCLDCGATMEEPAHITLARLTALVERPRSRIATRPVDRGRRRRSLTLGVRP